jgi:hypothetical protein
MDVTRMNTIIVAVINNVPTDEVAQTPEEEAFYDDTVRSKKRAAQHGLGLDTVHVFPD